MSELPQSPCPKDQTPRPPEPFSPPSEDRSKGPDMAVVLLGLRNLNNPHPVARLKALSDLRAEVDRWMLATVAEAISMRPKRATWAEIGKATGRSRTAAHAYWDKKVADLEREQAP